MLPFIVTGWLIPLVKPSRHAAADVHPSKVTLRFQKIATPLFVAGRHIWFFAPTRRVLTALADALTPPRPASDGGNLQDVALDPASGSGSLMTDRLEVPMPVEVDPHASPLLRTSVTMPRRRRRSR
jgi:hypothetical protein